MQDCLNYRRPSDDKRHIFVGDGKSVEVEAIGHFRLLLRTGLYLDLKDTLLYCHLDEIWFLFLYWTNLVVIVLLKTISLAFH